MKDPRARIRRARRDAGGDLRTGADRLGGRAVMTHDQQVAMIALVPMIRRALERNNIVEACKFAVWAERCLNVPEAAAAIVAEYGEPK